MKAVDRWQLYRRNSGRFVLLWLALGAVTLAVGDLSGQSGAGRLAWAWFANPLTLVAALIGLALGAWGLRALDLTRTGGRLLLVTGLLLLLLPLQVSALAYTLSAAQGLTAAILALSIGLAWPGLANWLTIWLADHLAPY